MRGGEGADAEQRRRDRDVRALGELADDVAGARDRDAVPGQDHRLLRRVDQVERVLDLAGHRAMRRAIAAQLRRVGPHELARALLRVLGDVDQHRAGAARARHVERLADRLGDFVGAGHQVVVLGDRQGDAGDVGFLKGIGADQLAADLAGDADDGDRVEHRRRQAGDHVGRARARRGDGHADLAGRARIAVRHVRGALLVPHQDVADRVVEHRVVGRQDGAAGIAEDARDAFARERFPKDLRAGLLGGGRLVVSGSLSVLTRTNP